MYWGSSSNEWFSTKSSINLIQKEKGHSSTGTDWIWKLNIPPKIKQFMWRITKDGLPTKGKLEQRHISVPTQCEFCNQTYEDFYHLFVSCQNTRNIFKIVDPKIEKVLASFTNHNITPLELVKRIKKKLEVNKIETLAFGWWSIWYFRNQIIFNNEVVNNTKITEFIKKQEVQWRNSVIENDKSEKEGTNSRVTSTQSRGKQKELNGKDQHKVRSS